MIHLTLIIVDFLTGLIMAGFWALMFVAGLLAAAVAGIAGGIMLFRRGGRRP